ncbi:MAG TPA: GNAT family N-acetyltransferase [Vicinamibacterales bacterium]|nr:GNAT family N-acetyltransferase [Vicinamibacterales bacterium]
MPIHAALTVAPVVRALRTRYRQEMNCQIVKDSIHTRAGWSLTYALGVDDALAGFGTVAIGGPWTGKPTILEFYVLPEHRTRAFDLFEAFVGASGARLMEIQSNDLLLAAMLHAFAREVTSEAIVFRDGVTTALQVHGAVLQPLTSDAEVRASIAERQGGPEFLLHVDGTPAGKGGILFHYNRPYGDVYMEIDESFRGRGLGAYLVQELKRQAYEIGSIPAARCSPNNRASRKTLQRAGFVPYAHILNGTLSDG